MTNKLFEIQLEELSIIAENFTPRHRLEYKLDILKNSLETLQNANTYVEIPFQLLEKVDKIFKLMPNHERYFVEINYSNHQMYLKLIEELEASLIKNYVGKVDELKKHLKILVGNISGIFLIYSFLSNFLKNHFKTVEEYYGYVCLIFIGLSFALFLYQRIKWIQLKHSKIY